MFCPAQRLKGRGLQLRRDGGQDSNYLFFFLFFCSFFIASERRAVHPPMLERNDGSPYTLTEGAGLRDLWAEPEDFNCFCFSFITGDALLWKTWCQSSVLEWSDTLPCGGAERAGLKDLWAGHEDFTCFCFSFSRWAPERCASHPSVLERSDKFSTVSAFFSQASYWKTCCPSLCTWISDVFALCLCWRGAASRFVGGVGRFQLFRSFNFLLLVFLIFFIF